jgi:AcrR family transcriptional regulator
MARQARQRRSNADRSAETREKLLNAAERCLIELGYAQSSNLKVCLRAGVSNGALLHHFRTRENLVASTLERVYEQLTRQVRDGLEGTEPGSDRLDRAVDLLWSIFDSDRFKVILEIWLAAANDKRLRRRVFPVMRELADSVQPRFEPLLQDVAGDTAHLTDVMNLFFYALEGMGLNRSTFGPEDIPSSVRQLMKEMLRCAVDRSARPRASSDE